MKKLAIHIVLATISIATFIPQSLQGQPSPAKPGEMPLAQTLYNEQFADFAIPPIPLSLELNRDKVQLGEKLFHDTRLSSNNTVSCASCHDLTSMGGTIQAPKAAGVTGKLGKRNPPTVFNSASHLAQHWDGKFATLEQQLHAPMLNPNGMGNDWPTLLRKIASDTDYVRKFYRLYPDEAISIKSVSDAIATFERSLYTPNSPFDQFLRGNKSAISEQAKKGHQLFSSLGCISCHQGVNIGGNLYQKLGIFKPYKANTNVETPDFGRYLVTGIEADKFVFKVPSLRNIAKTAPYLHDGSINTLEEVVELMAEHQLGRTLGKQEITNIVAFLESLTGTYKGEPL